MTEIEINQLLCDLIEVLHRHGLTSINLGGLMRLVGMDNESAVDYDGESLEINTALAVYTNQLKDLDHTSHTLH